MHLSEEVMGCLLKTGQFNSSDLRYHECSTSTETVARTLGLRGYRSTISTACTSGASAIAVACNLLQAGLLDVVVAGGVDSLSRLTINGFASLLIVSDEGPRPFDAERKGMGLGEGAAFVVLERLAHAKKRNAQILAVLAGYGLTCDAHHATAPDPSGRGAAQAMRNALNMAQLAPAAVDYINAHGTGTLDNDKAESLAIGEVFKDAMPAVSSTKRYFGHTLAASGAIEAVLAVMCLQKQYLPPNLGLRQVDSQVPFEPLREMRSAKVRHVLSNSFGFGGNNCSLLFSAP